MTCENAGTGIHKCPATVIVGTRIHGISKCNCCDSCRALCKEMAKQELYDHMKDFRQWSSFTNTTKRRIKDWFRIKMK